MRKLSISFAAVALVGFAAASADAQCAFDGPAKAKGMKVSLVRSFASCPGITFTDTNSTTGTNVPTCAAPFAHSVFKFDNKSGKCDFKTSAKLEAPCSVGTGNCMNMALQAKCSGILQEDGVSPINDDEGFGSGWGVNTVTRATLNDPTNGDMTVIDFPVRIDFPTGFKGKLGVKTDTNFLLVTGLGLDPLPECTSLEIVSLSVQGPDNQPFAVIGAGARPKGL